MPLTETFSETSTIVTAKGKAKRIAPFSLRLSREERTRLLTEAKGTPLGGYIKAKLFGTKPLRVRRAGGSVEDREALARALALLGRSRLANNLNQLAHAANIGTLPITPEIEAEISEAIQEVRLIRLTLMLALGLQSGGTP
jgi:hypothetical protein